MTILMEQRADSSEVEDLAGVLRRGGHPISVGHRLSAEAITVHETSFFRDLLPFEMLRETVLPGLIARRGGERRLRIWSAACSTGQEAYSVAMLLCESFPEIADWDVRIVASDLSQEALDTALAGHYRRAEVNRGLPIRMLLKYLEPDGDEWVVNERVRRMCEFRLIDLCKPLPMLPVFDIVLLRNVLLYLPHQQVGRLFEEVKGQMAADGYLVLGCGEQAEDWTRLFGVECVSGGYVYRPVNGM